jgi:hypothetical protein
MYIVDGLTDSVQCGWCADREISHGHIIVYRSNESHNSEVTMACNLFIRDAIWPGLTIHIYPGANKENEADAPSDRSVWM